MQIFCLVLTSQLVQFLPELFGRFHMPADSEVRSGPGAHYRERAKN